MSSTTLPTDDEMYHALLRRDSGYDGLFFVAVKTTGIFCRPTCPAKKPLRKNVE
jgi:AraC family transcriptional regulator of adaptative response/methylated-DNA-[protein]-cysteine methyltransferase